MLGAGMVVYGDRANMLEHGLNASTFFRNESCGKCVPCRIGSQKLVELAGGILQFQYDEESIRPLEKLLTDLQRTLEMTSICGLGMVAGNPLITVFRHFRQDMAGYLRSLRLPTMIDLAPLRGTMVDRDSERDRDRDRTTSPILKGRRVIKQDELPDFEILGDPGHE
jgi:hypothetical protein